MEMQGGASGPAAILRLCFFALSYQNLAPERQLSNVSEGIGIAHRY